MKGTTLFLICLTAIASAELMDSKMTTLLEMKMNAGDAMDVVMEVLNDLK